MTDEIPPNFDKPWAQSDVSLVTLNSGEKLLHVNKAVLSVFSPMLRAMFSQNFKEGSQTSVELSVEYNAMLEILRVIFHVNRDFSTKGQKAYSSDEIADIYRAADYLDIGLIRKLCFDQINERPGIDMAMAALELDLHDLMMSILGKIGSLTCNFVTRKCSHRSSSSYLTTKIYNLCRFSKHDVYTIYPLVFGGNVPTTTVTPESTRSVKDIPVNIENARMDITKKWFASNVAIQTMNSTGLLYANKGTLASVSEYFRQLFFDENMAEKDNKDDDSVLKLDVEYVTMKAILSIIHFSNMKFFVDSQTLYDPILLYDMCRVSSSDHLDIPVIRSLCGANLLKQPTLASAEVAATLCVENKHKLLELLDYNTFIQFLNCSERNLVYTSNEQEFVISAKKTDQVFSLNDVRVIVERLKNQK